jgi:Fructose-2,6-bisphosphatase
MVVVVLVRHAQSTANAMRILSHDADKHPITDEGREQAKRVARELKKLKVARLYTSPVLRAYQTSAIIGQELDMIPVVDDRLRERFLGELNNKRMPEGVHWKLKLYYGEVKDVEQWEEMKRRMLDFINSLTNIEGVVVAVSHHDPIKGVISHILGLDDLESMGLIIPNSHMTIIKWDPSPKILAIGTPLITNALLDKINGSIKRGYG